MLTLSYGVLIEFGVGMLYGVPLFIVNNLSSRPSLYNGIVLSGFGLSSLIMGPVLIGLILGYGLSMTFLILTVIFLVSLLILVPVLQAEMPFEKNGQSLSKPSFSKKLIRIYIFFAFAIMIGLLMIGLTQVIGVAYYQYNDHHMVFAIGVFALLNGGARPLMGWVVDRFGFFMARNVALIFIVVVVVLGLINQGQSFSLFIVSMGLFWFSLGAFLAMLPVVARNYFEAKNYASNYGFLFTAYGVGAILGTVFS